MKNKIIKRLPQYYHKSLVMWRITDAESAILNEFDISANEFDRELYVSTAERKLGRYEADLKLDTPLPIPPKNTDEYNDWLNLRRSNILAKMRGYGACTETMIIMAAECYTDGKVSIDRSCYNDFILKLVFKKIGIPKFLSKILSAVSEIKPAHMLLDFKIRRRTWGDIFYEGNTWQDVSNHTWQDILDKEDIL